MHGPATAGWLVVALCVAAGTCCALRLRRPARGGRGTAGGEALMGFGMAAMAVPATAVTPPSWAWTAYAAVFGAGALRALGPARRASHHLHHLVGMLAMVYMSVSMALLPGGTHATHAGDGPGSAGGTPLATGVLLIYYAGYVLWTGARLLPLQPVPERDGAGGGGHRTGVLAKEGGGAATAVPPGRGTGTVTEALPDTVGGDPDDAELTLACRLSMGIAMLAMLLTL
ncbi:DUF5134 domain-containing protein [Streptomyces sp. NBC_01498]|uniref:DUF5134 domain-containing protein n=1 Tax=Streptomyces sp. NBC_01498 TaxID=2975870 RepID=UPI002E7BB360|nr:DUF5134 domain-containing protein [Streptomyces sp. NBC_01498]WTL28208.1 DUF5134 domain-containing protein [Streptomyces sp. NBC_01498]